MATPILMCPTILVEANSGRQKGKDRTCDEKHGDAEFRARMAFPTRKTKIKISADPPPQHHNGRKPHCVLQRKRSQIE
jgi:hypothetical protein